MGSDRFRAERFEIGRVIEHTFGAVGRNFLPFYILAFVLTGVPSILIQWSTAASVTGGASTRAAFGGGASAGLGGFVSIFTVSLLYGAITWGTVSDLNGRKSTSSELLRQGTRAILPVLGVTVLYALGLILGFVLLVIPGIFLLAAWSVVIPAQVIERPGGIAAFGRSLELTRGRRWAVLGLMVTYVIGSWIVGGVLGVVLIVISSGGFHAEGMVNTSPVGIAVLAVVTSAIRMVGAVGVGALYYELRSTKEGVAPTALANVFA